MSKVLGLDLGPNSVGWALIENDDKEIIDLGSRVFQAGVNNFDTAKEQSKNAQRREARSKRKQTERKSRRKKRLFLTLSDLGFINIPKDEFMTMNPYEIRKKGLDEKLSLEEFARAMYHIIQRRGFKSNRKAQSEEEEKGKIYQGKDDKKGINDLIEGLENTNTRTIGEYFYKLNPHKIRIRNRFTLRRLFEEEFEQLWDKQKEFYPDILTDDLKKQLKDEIIFFQRPLKSQKDKIGKCKFEPKKTRAHKSHPDFQEFRMLQQVNMMKFFGGDRIEEHQQILTDEERSKVIEYLTKNKKIPLKNLNSIKKILGLKKETRYQFNLKDLNEIKGLCTIVDIRKAVGEKKFIQLTDNDIEKLWNQISFFEDAEIFEINLLNKWKFTKEQTAKILKIKLEQDYADLSLKAIRKMMPFMREGDLYHEAAQKAGYNHSFSDKKVEIMDKLPEPKTIGNPLVMVALHQLKKVVNAIIETYGKPDEIKVEMTRSLKISSDKRKKINSDNRKLNEKHNEIREILLKEGFMNPSRDDIIKYKLWEECNKVDPYTGKTISFSQLFGENPEFEIEHILPYSRTLDNSYMNKALCHRTENKLKGNKTPYEFYGNDENKMYEIKERIKTLPHKKAQKFLRKELNVKEEFISRQLNDTAYISREAKDYLKYVCKKVDTVTGSTTGYLRKFWGLNSLLRNEYQDDPDDIKNRSDHRHHAIDAVVIACTTRSMLQQLSTYSGITGHIDDDIIQKFSPPWDNFRNDLKNKVKNIIVSHNKKSRIRGQLHEDTFYGRLYNTDGVPMEANGKPLYAVRKPLQDLTDKMVSQIIDPVVKEIVIDRLKEFNQSEKISVKKGAFDEPLFMINNKGDKTQIKKVRIAIPLTNVVKLKDYNIYAKPGNNHHIAFYRKDKERKAKVVSLYEVNERAKNNKPIIEKTIDGDWVFDFLIQRNDMFMYGSIPDGFEENDKSTYNLVFNQVYRVQKFDANMNIVSRLHFTSVNTDSDNFGVLRRNTGTFMGTIVSINELGFIKID